MSRISEETREAIRKAWPECTSYNELARQFKVSPTTVHAIIDPKFADHRRVQTNEQRARRGGDHRPARPPQEKRPITLAKV